MGLDAGGLGSPAGNLQVVGLAANGGRAGRNYRTFLVANTRFSAFLLKVPLQVCVLSRLSLFDLSHGWIW